ncbi:MAG: FAD-binding and (Fe-S)-binding domain-containing protein [Propioniciclava sp.]
MTIHRTTPISLPPRSPAARKTLTRAIDRHAYAADASHYLLLPETVIVAADTADMADLLAESSRTGVPLTLRSGGTSLSGQSVTDQVLVDVRRNFRQIEVLDDGARVRIQPGATVRQVNARLARYGRQLGPDPASESACTIGGVIANNSSGMSCGTQANTYQTLTSMTFVLPSGTTINTATTDADARLQALEPALHAGLAKLRDQVRADPHAVAELRRQYALKNTMGYGLNSLLDHDTPVEILAHLLIGAEGTLGFVAEAVFRTVPRHQQAATGLLFFDNLEAANSALPALVATGAAAIELMDTQSLRVGQRAAAPLPALADLALDHHAALLLEYQAATPEELITLTETAQPTLARVGGFDDTSFSSDPQGRARLWQLRKGLYAAVAGSRPTGTTALLEDIAVPVDSLAATCSALKTLFERHAYTDSVIFGHAKDGNLHFMITDNFAEAEPLSRYDAFTEELVDLVLGQGGTLKAEHGTGRVMAPYVERQYGPALYQVMRTIKQLVDPAGVMNPGVLITDDQRIHLKHMKTTPAIEPEVDGCVECGYCEPVCPSRDLTLTPRQRIVVHRAIAAAEAAGASAQAEQLKREAAYDQVATCAVDGMCQTACPLQINTGDLVKRLRTASHPPAENLVWNAAAHQWKLSTGLLGSALTAASRVPAQLIGPPNRLARAVFGNDRVPLWSPELPAAGRRRARPAPDVAADFIYFPSCQGTMFGPAEGGEGVQVSFERLVHAAGLTALIPAEIDALCCGTPWSSKGFPAGAEAMRSQVLPVLHAVSQEGALVVVCDAASCTEGLRQQLAEAGNAVIKVVDAVTYVADTVLPRLEQAAAEGRLDLTAPTGRLALHPTCASTRLGLDPALQTVADAAAAEVVVPDDWGCCGFAGDRGLLHPELTAAATATEAADVRALQADSHASCNRACELGMTRAVAAPYHHVLELLARRLGSSESPTPHDGDE